MIYLDHNSSTLVCQNALDKMMEFSKKYYASPLSHNKIGSDVNYHLENAYQLIYDFIGLDYADTFVFTASGAEAVSHVLFGVYYDVIKKTGKTHVITIKSEDAPILIALKRLEDLGCVIHTIEVKDDGLIDLEELKKLINPKVALVSMSWANGLTGVMQPVDLIADICEKNDVLLHIDASYILGKIYLPFNDIPIHYLTFAGDLIHGPKSSGGIVMKKGYELSPFIYGEKSQGGNHGAPLDVSSLMGFSAACQQCILSMDTMTLEVAKLRADFEKKIKSEILDVEIFYEKCPRLPNVSCMAFDKVHSEALAYYLNQKNVYMTFGGNRMQHLSNVIKGKKAFSAISFALSRYTTKEMIEEASNIVIETVMQLQKMSCNL